MICLVVTVVFLLVALVVLSICLSLHSSQIEDLQGQIDRARQAHYETRDMLNQCRDRVDRIERWASSLSFDKTDSYHDF